MRIVPAGALAAAIALSAAACSSGGSGGSGGSGTSSAASLSGTPDQIVQRAVNDLKAAKSLQISGNVVSSGSNVKLDLTDVAAAGCKGTVGIDTSAASSSSSTAVSGTADLIEVSSTVYMKLDASFFKNLDLPSAVFSEVNGKYIEVTSKSELANFAQLCDPSNLASGFDKEVTGFVKDGTATINGQPAEAFKQPTHSGSGIVYISQSATPEIIRLHGPSNEGQINFTDYNAPVTITAPPASEVVQGSKFGL
jgi:hypothetical protein